MYDLLREKVAQFLEDEGVFEKVAAPNPRNVQSAGRGIKDFLRANRGRLGVAAGIGGTLGAAKGLSSLGEKEQQQQQQAAEMNQLLEAYPELMYATPQAPYQEAAPDQGYYPEQEYGYGGGY
jgi:hypothetical protein